MRLTILGCSGSIPGPGKAASGYLLEAEGFLLGVELGNGTLAELQTRHDPFDLGALVLSHLHPDHCADFGALTVLRRYHPAPPFDVLARRLPVHAPENAPARLAKAYAPNDVELAETDLSDVYDFHALGAAPVRIGPFELTAVAVDHPTEAFGLRISHGGRTLAYTGDTGPCPQLDELARGVDVLLSEATWTDAPERPPGVHLSGRQAGELASRAGAGQLLLTHVAPWSDAAAILAEAKAAFPGAVLVEQGATYEL
ncbi:ribonuclease BN (tRNA processing enzyme) [Amycolatopsis bartoniae]|uniref:MBL fold metallo-hydrolase n=1 Tax=Amycolatopsis bartoniae TaxID=941986 RepID=UPI0011909F3F|nr:MBL fold metallo-hydrolase [Amycolatopsis bartoniae]MBB2936164.1 ribonuclease BN (tRNA processing enzyme) [Amycolatopsis bartoniae]TVT07126.1 MBL fold metallo-hydrolase [Amycolatopsis bartoniae]